MARSETFEYCADTLAAATSEIQRLVGICEHVHDRMLRGDDDMTLMRKLQEGWQGPNAELSDRRPKSYESDCSACCFTCLRWIGNRKRDRAWCNQLFISTEGKAVCRLWVKRPNARSTPND
jgi:hypothetical protein